MPRQAIVVREIDEMPDEMRKNPLVDVTPDGPIDACVLSQPMLTAALTGYVALQSWAVLGKLRSVGQTSMATEIPMVIPHAAVTLSFALMSVIALVLAFRRTDGDSP